MMPKGPKGEKRPADVIGTAVMVYPVGTIYGQFQPEDVAEIVEEHLEKAKAVERLALMKLPMPSS